MCWLLVYLRHKTFHDKGRVAVVILELAQGFTMSLINRNTRLFERLPNCRRPRFLATANTTTRQAPALVTKPTSHQ